MPFTSESYDASFKSIGFLELFESSYSSAEQDTEEEIAVQHLPGSNTSIIQSSGRLKTALTLPIAALSSQISSLRAAVGSSGTLAWHKGSQTGRLTKVSGVQKVRGLDVYKAVLTLYLS
jgi:hypothetical protein